MKEMNTVTNSERSSRYLELKKMLEDRRRELQAEVQGKMRNVRATGEVTKLTEVYDAVESSEADIQEDIALALIQMRSETAAKGDAPPALQKQGTSGNWLECGEEIAENLLRALRFAVRCRDCEE